MLYKRRALIQHDYHTNFDYAEPNSINPDRYLSLWLFFGFPWLVGINIRLSDIILAFAGQISIIIATHLLATTR